MTTAYIDTSSFLRALLTDAPGHVAAKAVLADQTIRLVSSKLLAVEADRVAVRVAAEDPAKAGLGRDVGLGLARIQLAAIDNAVIAAARAIPEPIKSLDAIHVATAAIMAEAIDYAITDDKTMAKALRVRGIAVRGTLER
ncbi:MAG: PIN domain-containing protein [Bifidobacteriaceae bacterium]|nr:PIN domain-containing protein [Bifidobacteriaceae bacterium]